MPESSAILTSLDLEQVGEHRFRGPSVPSDTRPVVFGGQIMGQMIMAAAACQPQKQVRSLHVIFARAGTVTEPVVFEVGVMHAGRTMASMSVTAGRQGRLISRGLLLLDGGDPDLIRHSLPMPGVAGPAGAAPQSWAEPGSEVRVVGGVDLMTAEVTGDPELFVWARFSAAPDRAAVHQALLCWYTDPFLIGTAMRPHPGVGQAMAHGSVSTGVLTHTLSFHQPARATEWLLLAQHSHFADGGRVYGTGSVFTEDGRHVASFAQDSMVRAGRDARPAAGHEVVAHPRATGPATQPPAGRSGKEHRLMGEYRFLRYELLDEGIIARITLDRPRTRNAQNRGLLVELGDAFLRAEADDTVRVVILCGAGPLFSAGHDMGSAESVQERGPGPGQHESYAANGGTRPGAENRMLQEWHYFFENTRRWRNLRKVTIAQVQGPVYAAGLMLMWACDLIVAADNASFADVVGTRLGMCGVEYFAHPWEFGPRRAKELLLTGDSLDAQEAYRLGMVSKVFPVDVVAEQTVAFARRIAQTPTMAALLIKESVNQSVDNMGFYNALNACFTLHQLNHAHWAEINEDHYSVGTPAHGVVPWNQAPPVRPAVKDAVQAPAD
jgi:enoyl-CoA hydratase